MTVKCLRWGQIQLKAADQVVGVAHVAGNLQSGGLEDGRGRLSGPDGCRGGVAGSMLVS